MTRTLLILALIPLAGVTARGHHSFAASYDEAQIISVAGNLTEFEYRSPHAWVHIRAMDKAGQMRTVSAEWGNPRRLTADGIKQDTLRAGDWLILTGSPSRDPSEYRMHLKGIERPVNGWRWGRSSKTR